MKGSVLVPDPQYGKPPGSEWRMRIRTQKAKIAKKFKITPDELMKVNGITDPKKIQIGQKLKIPASQKKTSGVK